MGIGIVSCKVLEREIKTLVQKKPEVTHFEVMEWGPHLLKQTIEKALKEQNRHSQK